MVPRAAHSHPGGSSVTIVAPTLAASLGLLRSAGPGVELQTVAGLTAGPAARLASLRVGDAELRDVPVGVPDSGPDMDGIYRRLLHLQPPSRH